MSPGSSGLANRMGEQTGRMISVVDDDASLRRSLRNLLVSAGFRVETFESAEAFLDSGAVDTTGCLVLDVRMPGMGGLGLLTRLAIAGIRMPVIILTALEDEDLHQRMLQEGAIAFLKKPVKGPILLGAIRSALSVT